MSWVLLQNSLLVSGATAIAAPILGLAAALALSSVEARWRRVLLGAAVIGLALPPFLVTNCWLDLLGQNGRWRGWLPLDIYSLGGTVWVLSLLLWPISLLLGLASFAKIQPSQLEWDPALRGSSMIRWLLLPIAWPALVLGIILTFVLAFNNFAVPAILQTKVYPAELWVSFNTTFDYLRALQLSWPLCLGPVLLLLLLRRFPTVEWPRGEGGVPSELFRRRLGRCWTSGAGVLTALVLFLSIAVPLGQLGLSARTWLELSDAFSAGRMAVWNSFWFAALTATLGGVVGLVLWRSRGMALLWLLFLVPGVLLGIGLIFALNRGVLVWIYQSAAVVVLGLSLRYAALSWTGARAAMRSVPPGAADFAKLNGASAWQRWRHVHWPLIAPEMAAIWFVTYLLCLWDVETLVLIIPPGYETLAVRVFNLLHYGHNGQVNALCVILVCLAVLPIAVRTAGRAIAKWTRLPFGTAALACLMLVLAGCGRSPSQGARIQSAFFSGVQVIGTRGTALGQFNKPRSLTLDAQDNLYVVDMTGRVQKFSPAGAYLASWQMPQTDKGKPKGMCRDAKGNIVVVEPHYTRVNHFTPEGKLLTQWGQPGTNSGQLCLPRAVAVNSNGDVVLCEYTLVDRVQVFSADGKTWKRTIGRSGRADGEFNRPEGLAVDAQDRLYVADSCNHRIQVFSPSGEFIRAYGHAGSGPGQLSYPYDVQIDHAGRQYVCEFGNSRIQIFDREGKSVELLGGAGSAPGQFSNPWSVALDSVGNLYVADSQNHRVQKFIAKPAVDGKHTERLDQSSLTARMASAEPKFRRSTAVP